MIGALSIGGLVVPSSVALVALGAGLTTGWIIVTVYIIALGFTFFLRFLGGRWRSMRVIEPHAVVPPSYPEAPTGEP